MDTVFRSLPEGDEAPKISNFKENEVGAEEDINDIEPVENGEQVILEGLGISDSIKNLPEEDRGYLTEVSGYLKDMLAKDGITPTRGAYERALTKLKESLDLDPDTEPSVAVKKMGGLVKSWKSVGFIKDAGERRKLFFKLAQADTVEKMDSIVFDEYEKRKIWQ